MLISDGMQILDLPGIQQRLKYPDVIGRMRAALIAYSRGECETPMPMHLDIAPQHAEVHMKSSYRRGGRYFALKIAATFPGNIARGLSVGNGMMLLSSAETGEPVAFLADGGHLTDVRTAADGQEGFAMDGLQATVAVGFFRPAHAGFGQRFCHISPHDWYSRGIGRTMPLAPSESLPIWRALHSPRGLSGAVVMDGVVLHPGTLHERLPWCVHRDGRAAAMSERSP